MKSIGLRKSLFLIGAVLAIACSPRRDFVKGGEKIFYSDGRFVHLISPAENSLSTEENQRVSGAFGNRKFSSDAWMLLNDSTIHLILFGDFGNTVAELVYTGDSVHFKSPWMDAEKIKPEYILSDIQFCYYPKEALEKNFSDAGFSFVEENRGNVLVRKLFDGNLPILEMERTEKKISLKNDLRHYSYAIEFERLR